MGQYLLAVFALILSYNVVWMAGCGGKYVAGFVSLFVVCIGITLTAFIVSYRIKPVKAVYRKKIRMTMELVKNTAPSPSQDHLLQL